MEIHLLLSRVCICAKGDMMGKMRRGFLPTKVEAKGQGRCPVGLDGEQVSKQAGLLNWPLTAEQCEKMWVCRDMETEGRQSDICCLAWLEMAARTSAAPGGRKYALQLVK